MRRIVIVLVAVAALAIGLALPAFAETYTASTFGKDATVSPCYGSDHLISPGVNGVEGGGDDVREVTVIVTKDGRSKYYVVTYVDKDDSQSLTYGDDIQATTKTDGCPVLPA